MSLKDGSMAAQGEDVNHVEASSSSSPQAIGFVKSIDRKARSYLKTLERSFSFSTTESKGEDPSTMTIEFLRVRLQAQRADYKAEKQRSQLLAKKVLELERRLSFEIEQRRKVEGNNMQVISSNHHGGHPSSRLKHTRSCNARDFMDFKLKDKVSGEDDLSVWCPEVLGNEGHPDMWHRRECLRWERQQNVDQHVISHFNEGVDGASGSDKESFTLSHRDRLCEATSSVEFALSMVELEAIADQESAKLQINRQASASHDADRSFKFDCSQEHKHVIPMDSCCPNYQVKVSQIPIHPLAKRASSNLLLQRGMHVCVESPAKRPQLGTTRLTNLPPMCKSAHGGHDKVFAYIAPESHTTKPMQEEADLRKLSNVERRSKFMKEVVYSEDMTDQEISAYRVQRENTTLKTCRSFSDVEARYVGKLHIHRRMSLDSSLDRLQKVGMDGEPAKF